MGWVESEYFRLICPGLADVFVWRQSFECLEPSGEVVGHDEVAEVGSPPVVSVVVIAFDRGLLKGSVHALDLSVGPRVIGFGQAVFDPVTLAGAVKRMTAQHGRRSLAVLRQVGERDAVVGGYRVDALGRGRHQGGEKSRCGFGISDTPSRAKAYFEVLSMATKS